MLHVADAVNEDKRRLENLQRIDAWQMAVSGWTGPKLRDTSRQLLCQGLLTKWTRTAGQKVLHTLLFGLCECVCVCVCLCMCDVCVCVMCVCDVLMRCIRFEHCSQNKTKKKKKKNNTTTT